MRVVALSLGAALALAGCCGPRAVAPGYEEEGVAGYYGREFEGHRTASGSVFHAEGLTCAHRVLPFGTVLDVERTDAPGHVRVTVTDRGPFVSGRIIDLSLGAARKLGITHAGLAPVRLRVVSRAPQR